MVLGMGLTAAGAAGAALPAKNLGFEDWDARGNPEGWRVQNSERFSVASDCAAARAGGCALRIQGEGNVHAPFLPLAQPMGAGPAAGHRLKLSGWIRTEALEGGWAGLWARADVEGKTMALENMHREGPRGTTDWKRFEIAIDVPSNATLISFGVLLSGKGTAWFDDLALEVDDALKIGRAVKTEVVIPARPVPGAGHVPDESLRLPQTQAPTTRAEWREQVQAAAQPIRSLWSEDFSDLQFLKPLLAGRRVVQLGESGHGIAEFNWMKVRLVKFLHREMGFDVVAFESSLTGCDLADQRVGKAAPVDVMRDAIFPVWHSTETLGLFEYLDAERTAGRRLSLAGFDVQNSGRVSPEVSTGLVRQVRRVDAELARRIEGYEGKLRHGMEESLAGEMKAAYQAAADRLAAERVALKALETRPVAVELAIQELRSRIRYAEQLSLHPDMRRAGRARDRGMADNLDFVLDTLYPGRKVIVWAHNGHIARYPAGAGREGWMGSLVGERRGTEVYTVGLYMGWGIGMHNDRKRYEILPAGGDSLEAVLANGGWRLAFVDLTNSPASSWARTQIGAREWGLQTTPIVPAEYYDALIYIDAVTPPEYL